MKWWLSVLGFVVSFSVLAEVRWQGTSGGYKVTISDKDISATDAEGKLILSLKKDFDESNKAEEAEEGWESQITYRPLSLVGPYLSLQVFMSAYMGGAHPMAATSFVTMDLRDPKKPATLLTWYDDKTIATQLSKDKVLKKHLKLKKNTAVSMEMLENNFVGPEDCKFTLTKEAVGSFAFYSLEKEQVAVRVGLSHGCETARGSLTQFGILLPIPSAIAEDLKAAADKKAGFLMKDSKAFGEVSFSWEYKKG